MLLTGLHDLAARRGDGLRPELLALLKERQALRASGVTDMADRRDGGIRQAGPNPARSVAEPLPEGVLAFSPKPALPDDPAARRTANGER